MTSFIETEPEPDDTAVLLLAAAPGSGFTGSRWLEAWGGTTLIEHAVLDADRWDVGDVYVLLGDQADDVAAVCAGTPVTIVIDPEWAEGPSSWLRAGLDALIRSDVRGPVVVADGAMPATSTDVVSALLTGHDPEVAPVTVPLYRYTTGAPYVIDRELWPRLMSREGGSDLRSVWKAHPDWIAEIRFDTLPPRAISTPFDLAELRPSR